jgi:hypothetical protein
MTWRRKTENRKQNSGVRILWVESLQKACAVSLKAVRTHLFGEDRDILEF